MKTIHLKCKKCQEQWEIKVYDNSNCIPQYCKFCNEYGFIEKINADSIAKPRVSNLVKVSYDINNKPLLPGDIVCIKNSNRQYLVVAYDKTRDNYLELRRGTQNIVIPSNLLIRTNGNGIRHKRFTKYSETYDNKIVHWVSKEIIKPLSF